MMISRWNWPSNYESKAVFAIILPRFNKSCSYFKANTSKTMD